MKSRVFRWAIESLAVWHPHLYVEPYVVAFVAVTGQYSVPPERFQVDCQGLKSRWLGRSRQLVLEVSWTEETIDRAGRLRATMPARSLVELAAVAVALVLVHRVVPLGTLNVMEYGGRADYRSTTEERVLEVSGTDSLADLVGGTGRRSRRRWPTRSAGTPTCVCAFGAEGHQVRLSGHRWEESPNAEA